MNKKILIGFAGGSIASVALITGSFAYRGNPGQENPNPTNEQRHEQMEDMIENKDYEAFQELFEDRWPARLVDSKQDFEKWIDMKQAFEEGNQEKTTQLANNLGLGQKESFERKYKNHDQGMMWPNGQMYEILKEMDYQTFQNRMSASPIVDSIDSKKDFQKFVDMHKAIKNKNIGRAQDIRKELDINMWARMQGRHRNHDCPFHQNHDNESINTKRGHMKGQIHGLDNHHMRQNNSHRQTNMQRGHRGMMR